MRIVVRDNDGNTVLDGDVPEGEKLAVPSVKVWWHGSPVDREYTFRDVAVWWRLDDPDGTLAAVTDETARVALGVRLGAAFVLLQWVDDTDTNPRTAGVPADVCHTVEATLPGGGIGPFVVQVG